MGDILLFILIMVVVAAAFIGMLQYDPRDDMSAEESAEIGKEKENG